MVFEEKREKENIVLFFFTGRIPLGFELLVLGNIEGS